MDKPKEKKISTIAVQSNVKQKNEYSAITVPIVQSATYTFNETSELYDFFEGRTNRIAEYGRYGNPTQEAAQNWLKSLEGAEAALLFSSGMAAITTTLLSICKQGDHIVITSDSYRKTRQFVRQVLPRYGVTYTMVKPDMTLIEEAITPETKLIVSEAPTNPYLRVLDLEELVKIAKKHKVKTFIDSTLATPVNLRPLDFGVDLVTHSVTKYFAGHNDLMAGVVMGHEPIIKAIQDFQSIVGNIIDPFSCYLMIRGIKTFALRVNYQNQSALRVARFLESHPSVVKVWYPGLESHPDHAVASRLMKGFGGVISFQVKGGLAEGTKCVDSVKIPVIAPSLGGVDTLIDQPALMSYFELSTEEREKIGIFDNLIRLSIGIEDSDELIEDLKQALDKI